MSQANPLRLFVTHAWDNSDDYLRVFEYLESARNFFYKNYSTPDKRPNSVDREVLREDLRKQIAPAEAVLALSSLYATQQDLLTFQLLYAQANNKPVVLLKPFGAGEPPKAILDLAEEVVGWDERALVDAIRRQARHEETTRWDTIEFKLD
jgi:hypothetical protein